MVYTAECRSDRHDSRARATNSQTNFRRYYRYGRSSQRSEAGSSNIGRWESRKNFRKVKKRDRDCISWDSKNFSADKICTGGNAGTFKSRILYDTGNWLYRRKCNLCKPNTDARWFGTVYNVGTWGVSGTSVPDNLFWNESWSCQEYFKFWRICRRMGNLCGDVQLLSDAVI